MSDDTRLLRACYLSDSSELPRNRKMDSNKVNWWGLAGMNFTLFMVFLLVYLVSRPISVQEKQITNLRIHPVSKSKVRMLNKSLDKPNKNGIVKP